MNLPETYLYMKNAILSSEYADDVDWQESRDWSKVTEQEFLQNFAHVVLNSGMKASVIREKWPGYNAVFNDFDSAENIVKNEKFITPLALNLFGHKGKLWAIFEVAKTIHEQGWSKFKESINSIDCFESLPWIGPITKHHLAKNLGWETVKPDVHLVRMAKASHFDSPLTMCEHIKESIGDNLSVIDVVLWRYAADIDPDYLRFFNQAGSA